MAGRLPRVAGRHLTLRRLGLAVTIASAVAVSPVVAADEWMISPGKPEQVAKPGQWIAQTSSDTEWTISAGGAASVTGPESPGSILDQFVGIQRASMNGAGTPELPPVAPAAYDVPTVELDEDHPLMVALADAERRANDLGAQVTELRIQAREAGPTGTAGLNSQIADLEPQYAEARREITTIRKQITKLREKLAAREAAKALNPFTTLPGLTFAPLSGSVPVIDANLASRLDSYLSSKGSPLAGLGNVFVYQSVAVGLDPRLLVAISGAETSFGTYGPSQQIHNPFGMGPGIVYPTWEDSIASAARNLGGNLYKGSGLVTIAQIHHRWAPIGASNDPTGLNSNWYRNVSRYYAELGGDPTGVVFVDRGGPATAIPVAPAVAPGIQGTIAAPAAYGAAVAVPGGGRNVGPKAVARAQDFIGTPYRWGGATPAGFDSPGLVQYVYGQEGVRLPRTADEQARVGVPVAPEQLRAGDAIFFADRAGYIRHEGMYIGDGRFIHSPQSGGAVAISSLYDPYYASQYAGARRY